MVHSLLKSYNWDTPDGENCFYKTVHSAKVSGVIAFFGSLYDIIGITKPTSIPAAAARVGYVYVLPAAAAGAVFAGTSCVAGDYLGSDSLLSHALGGCAAGTIFGARAHNFLLGGGLCVGFGAAASLYKYGVLKGYDFTSGPTRESDPFHFYKHRRETQYLASSTQQ